MPRCKRQKEQPHPQPACVVLTNAGLRLLWAGFLFFTLRATIPPQTHHPKRLLLQQPKPMLSGGNLNCLGVAPAMTKHLSNPTLQFFFHKHRHFLSMLCALLPGSPFFCLTKLTNTLKTLFITLHTFSWEMPLYSGRQPNICCASVTAHEGAKLTG